MADKKSREVSVVSIEREFGEAGWLFTAETKEGKYFSITEKEYDRLWFLISEDNQPTLDFTQVLYEVHSDGSPIIDKDETTGRTIEMKIDVDVSEALTGLKAIQREAREATKALRELEAEFGKIKAVKDMRDI